MRKQTFILSIIILLTLLIIGGWLFFFLKQKRQVPPTVSLPQIPSPSASATVSVTPSPVPSQFELLSDHEVQAPVFVEKMIYFFDRTEKVLSSITPVLDVFKTKNLSETRLENVFSLSWSADKKRVLIGFYQSQLAKRYAVFDLEQNLVLLLPNYVQEAVWSPDGKKIAIHHYSPLKRESYLALLNPDGTKEEKFLELGLSELKFFWLANNQLIFYQKPAPLYPLEAVFSYDFSTKELKVLSLPLQEKYRGGLYGFDLLPSSDGKVLIFSLTDGAQGKLQTYLYSVESGQLTELPVKTLVQKCVFAENNESVYCAYSEELAQANGLPFSYWQGRVRPADSFARFNFRTGELKVYAEKTVFDALELVVSAQEDFLLFVNRAEGKLYRLRL